MPNGFETTSTANRARVDLPSLESVSTVSGSDLKQIPTGHQHRPGGGPSTHPTSTRWSVPARYSKTASSSNDPTNQRVVISKSRDTPIHRS
jgi:hypothetical protein